MAMTKAGFEACKCSFFFVSNPRGLFAHVCLALYVQTRLAPMPSSLLSSLATSSSRASPSCACLPCVFASQLSCVDRLSCCDSWLKTVSISFFLSWGKHIAALASKC